MEDRILIVTSGDNNEKSKDSDQKAVEDLSKTCIYNKFHIKKSEEIVVLDVGGRKFYTLASMFSTWPDSRFSNLIFY